jgi:hypothetical protein
MNPQVMTALTATGADQEVEVGREYHLVICPVGAVAQLRAVSGSTDYFPLAADVPFMLGKSDGAKVYILAAAGTVIRLMKM